MAPKKKANTSEAVTGFHSELKKAEQFIKKTLPLKLFIDGEFVDSHRGLKYSTVNPVTEVKIAEVAEADAVDVDKAVRAAKHAFFEGEWSKTSSYKRSQLLWNLATYIEDRKELFAALETLDNGKPYKDSFGADVPLVVQCFRYYAGWADKNTGSTLELGGPFCPKDQVRGYTINEPVGVVGQIIPWNFPLLMIAWKLGPALSVGCSVVLKAAEQTPLSALLMAHAIKEVGFPRGAVNILTGWGGQTTDGQKGPGAALVEHKDVDKIAFTGSTPVGRIIMKAAAQTFKRVTLELGGKSPNIVFADCNLDEAIKGAHFGLFFNQGQCCCAGSRLFVHEDVYDDFVKKTVELASARQVGDPFASASEQGPQVSQEQFDIVMGYIESGKQEGVKLACGGGRVGDKGYFVQPTVFVDVDTKSKIWNEEIFGPVMCVRKFKTKDEVVKMANDTCYGLAAAVWTNDISTAEEMQARLRAGTVWINCYDVFDAAAPFGGFKSSGIGRELGSYALRNYTEVKQVTIKYGK